MKNLSSKFYWYLLDLKFKCSKFISNTGMFIRSRIRLLWSHSYIRKDEFHSSLDMDIEALITMNEKQKEKYVMDLVKRRNIARQRDLDEH